MIRICLKIKNPWSCDLAHHDYFYKHKRLSKNKSFEIQIFRSSPYDLISFDLGLFWRGEDHAGPSLDLCFYKYCLNIKLYDHRHWDYEIGNWEVYNQGSTDND